MGRTTRNVALVVLALLTSGCTAWTWGRALDEGTGTSTPVVLDDDVLAVAAGVAHGCELRTDRSVWCRGDNSWGQLGAGDLDPVDGAQRVGDEADWRSIAAGEVHTCGLRPGDELWCWGAYPHHEQEPDGSVKAPTTPVLVGPGLHWASVAPATTHTCGILTDGALMCWGSNQFGMVGVGTTDVVEEPVRVTASAWNAVATAVVNTCAIRDDGTLWCWGALSQPDPDRSPTEPTLLDASTDWVALAGRDSHYCAIRADHSLWCWGHNHYGQLGVGDTLYRHLPTRVDADADWRAVSVSHTHTCAITQEWSLWCWGANDHGELGDGTADTSTVPVLVDDDRTWLSVDVGPSFTLAVSAR